MGLNTELKMFSEYYKTLLRNSKHLGTPISPFLRAECRLSMQTKH